MSRLLVVRGGAIGDFILTLPVLAALRRRFPQHRIELLGYPAIAALAAAWMDKSVALESRRFAGLFSPAGTVDPETAEWLAGFECIVSYLSDPQGVFQSNVTSISNARFIRGPHRPDEGRPVHACEQLLEPLRELGITDADPRPRLSWKTGGAPQGRIAAHPGSGSVKKNWPEDRWLELLKRIPSKILLIGGEAEGDRCARLAAVLPSGQVELARDLDLVSLAARMQNCAAFVGHDSGITHLAAAVGLPGVVLWGPSNLTVWRPRNERMKIVQGLDAPVEKVFGELRDFL